MMLSISTRRYLLGVVVCLTGAAAPAAAQLASNDFAPLARDGVAQLATRNDVAPLPHLAPSAQGDLSGSVVDERGRALAGAVVSALGATQAFAVSDRDGRFVFRNLSAGPYLVRAHLQGYLPARGRVLQVTSLDRPPSTIVLTRRTTVADPPRVLEAGLGTGSSETAPVAAAPEDRHGHDEMSWRMRHGKRSVLKDAEAVIASMGEDNSFVERSRDSLARAMEGSARLASALFSDIAINGQINLLTTTSFDRPQDLFSMNVDAPRGLAYVSLVAPGAQGDWSMRGTMTQGDVSSWIVAGSYVRHEPATHAYEAGLSYSTQRYFGGNAEALGAMRDGSRNVGTLYAYDTWTMNPRLKVSYGAAYGSYDYLADRGLLSPRLTVSLKPSPDDEHFTVRATMLRREIAPGAEEFVTPTVGLWLPPERTFSHVSRADFRPETVDHYEVSAERRFAGDLLVGVRAFQQRVDDQIVTVFGNAFGEAAQVGHYQVGSAGDVDVRGWGATVARSFGSSVRAAIDYTAIDAEWRSTGDLVGAPLERLASSVRRASERAHDVTASVDSVVAPTATRLLVVYKLNTAFAGIGTTETSPAPGVRFNVQVNQALPFLNFSSAQWEMLVAVSNLFHRELMEGSVYDELLVVRPPKRVLGGVTVRF
jgi:hypothetical protein